MCIFTRSLCFLWGKILLWSTDLLLPSHFLQISNSFQAKALSKLKPCSKSLEGFLLLGFIFFSFFFFCETISHSLKFPLFLASYSENWGRHICQIPANFLTNNVPLKYYYCSSYSLKISSCFFPTFVGLTQFQICPQSKAIDLCHTNSEPR